MASKKASKKPKAKQSGGTTIKQIRLDRIRTDGGTQVHSVINRAKLDGRRQKRPNRRKGLALLPAVKKRGNPAV